MPFVSVIMPVYNAAATLRESVESVRRQTMSDWELILVDDASADQSAVICNDLSKEDPRIRTILLPQNGGAGPARNRAIAEARGEYVAMLDADDVIDATLFQTAREALETNGVHTVVWGVTEEYVGENGRVKNRVTVLPRRTLCCTPDEVHRELLWLEAHTLFGYSTNKLYRRDLLLDHGIVSPNEPLYEDFWFNVAYAPHITSLITLPVAPYRYFKRGTTSLTSRFVPQYYALSEKRVKTMWALCREWGMADDEARRVLGGVFVRHVFSALQRNCDPRARMDAAARRRFIQELYERPLFQELIPQAVPPEQSLRLLGELLKHRRTALCLLAGRALYVIRERLPHVFSKASGSSRGETDR